MVAESFIPGASVSKVAQRRGVNANLSFTWRRCKISRRLAPVKNQEAKRSSGIRRKQGSLVFFPSVRNRRRQASWFRAEDKEAGAPAKPARSRW